MMTRSDPFSLTCCSCLKLTNPQASGAGLHLFCEDVWQFTGWFFCEECLTILKEASHDRLAKIVKETPCQNIKQ